MEVKEALRILAEFIWDRGESKHMGNGCINPDWIKHQDVPVAHAYDVLVKEFDATHFDRRWEERGKSVRINLYRSDAYGAAIVTPDMLVHSEVIQLGE